MTYLVLVRNLQTSVKAVLKGLSVRVCVCVDVFYNMPMDIALNSTQAQPSPLPFPLVKLLQLVTFSIYFCCFASLFWFFLGSFGHLCNDCICYAFALCRRRCHCLCFDFCALLFGNVIWSVCCCCCCCCLPFSFFIFVALISSCCCCFEANG